MINSTYVCSKGVTLAEVHNKGTSFVFWLKIWEFDVKIWESTKQLNSSRINPKLDAIYKPKCYQTVLKFKAKLFNRTKPYRSRYILSCSNKVA